jgi:hypothetical protein
MTISELFHTLEGMEMDKEEGLGSCPIVIKWGSDCQLTNLELHLVVIENKKALVIDCKDNFSTFFETLKDENLEGKKK